MAAARNVCLGHERIEMQFVSDVYVPCQTCEGRRLKDEVLQVEYNGRTVADILELDIDSTTIFCRPKRNHSLPATPSRRRTRLFKARTAPQHLSAESQRSTRYLGKATAAQLMP